MNKEMRMASILMIFSVIFTLIGSTFSFWIWRGKIAGIDTAIGIPFSCAADGGVHASTVALAPAACTHDRFAIQREITVDHTLTSPDAAVYQDMILTVNSIGSGLAESSNFKYALTKSADSCTKDVLATGTFKNMTSGSKINLLDDKSFNYSESIEKNTYYLYIWIDAVEENPNVLNQEFNFSLDLECMQGYESGAMMLINKANDASVTTYSSGDTTEMYVFSQQDTEQLSATTDYRYIGASPNNYITFNDEMWRIIGVFDGKIKIIRDATITSTMWDYKQSGIGSSTSSYGSNDWVDAQLMYMLNPNDITANVALKTGYTYDGTYVKDASGNIIYQKGCKPASASGTSYSCTTNSWSLNDTTLSQVADVTYYLGGSSTYQGHSASSYYTFERGAVKYNDVRSTNWTGKVGLMYPSDYAYTFAYGVDDTCYSDTYNCIKSTPSFSWLYTASYHQWTLTPYSGGAFHVFHVYSDGVVSINYVTYAIGVRPVVYLKDSTLLNGSGTSDDPYVITSWEDYVPPVEEDNNNTETGATMLIEKANHASITTYSDGVTTEMYTFSQPETTQLAATTDYRYIGASPNNYITFNDETWRIIGVFDGKIKIIKDATIASTSWDYKQSGIGSSTSSNGSNDWVDSQLMYMLNPNDIATNVALKTGYTYDGTYVYDASGNIIYQKGCKPASASGTSYSCTTNSWSLNSTALSQVADVTYYLGGTSSYTSLSTSGFYGIERGETKYNDVRSTNWTGKVGLMYPSDYGYTFAYGVDDTCYSNPFNCATSTPSSSWLYTSSYYQWTLSPYSGVAYTAFGVYSVGHVNSSSAYYAREVRPVVYLKSDITLTGTGTSSDPYVIG